MIPNCWWKIVTSSTKVDRRVGSGTRYVESHSLQRTTRSVVCRRTSTRSVHPSESSRVGRLDQRAQLSRFSRMESIFEESDAKRRVAGGSQPAVGIAVNVWEPWLRARCGLWVGEALHPGPVASQVRPRITEEANVRERSPVEDFFDSFRWWGPPMGRNVLRKVGVNSDSWQRAILTWSQDHHEVPLSVDSHDQRLGRVRQQLMTDGVGGQCQGMDRDVRAAESLFGNFAQRVGAVPQGVLVPPAIRRQRWSLVMAFFCGALRGWNRQHPWWSGW